MAKRSFDIASAKAMGVKDMFSKADWKAKNLLESMKQAEYAKEKASYEDDVKKLQQSVTTLRDSDSCFSGFILKDVADIKAAHPCEEKLEQNCNRFIDTLKAPVQSLRDLNSTVLMVIRARVSAAKAAAKSASLAKAPAQAKKPKKG